MFSFDVKPYRTKAGGITNLILVTGDATDSTIDYADFIINKTNEKIKLRRETMVESKNILNEVNFTGRDIAAMLGKDALDLYDRGVQKQQEGEADMVEAVKSFKNMVNKINECDKKRVQDILD